MIRRLTIWVASMTIGLLMMALVLASAAHAQPAAPEPTGDWHGVISTPMGELHIGLSFSRDASGTLAGALTSPDQTDMKFPLANVAATGGKLSFDVPAVGGSYAASWNAATQAWDGTWTQGMQLHLALTKGPVGKP